MHQEEIVYKDPIKLINDVFEEYGYLRGAYNNPLSILLHLFYSFGNGYEFIEEEGETFILRSKIVYDDGEKEENSLVDLYKETKNTHDKLLERYNADYYEKMLEDLGATNEQFEEALRATKMQLEQIEETVDANYFNFKPLENIDELRGVEFDTENKYWDNLVDIVSHYSLATQIPENLSPGWKEAFGIVTDKMNEADPERIAAAFEKSERQEKEWASR